MQTLVDIRSEKSYRKSHPGKVDFHTIPHDPKQHREAATDLCSRHACCPAGDTDFINPIRIAKRLCFIPGEFVNIDLLFMQNHFSFLCCRLTK